MDFSALATTVLTRVFGEYVDGLDPSNLEISILSGKAVMRNLKLKKTVLDKFNLAITVKEGFLGEIDIRIPWTKLGSESAIIKLSDVHILAQPVNSQDLSEDEIKVKQHQNKLSRLNLAALMGHDMPDTPQDKDKPVDPNSRGYFEDLAMRVIDNVQIFFDDVHFRYEDTTANTGTPFALGWTIESIHMRSCNENWEPMFMSDFGKTIHKLLYLTKLTTYFDTSPTLLKWKNDQDFCSKMKAMIRTPGLIHQQSAPISGYVRAAILKDTSDFSVPHFVLTILIHEVEGGLDMEEYECLSAWIKWVTNWNRKNNCQVAKPSVSVEQDPMAWWSYAYRAAIQQVDLKWNWDFMNERINHRGLYIDLYKIVRAKGGVEQLTESERTLFDQVQKRYPYEDLLSWRKLANAAFAYDEAKRTEIKEKKKKSSGWSWFGSANQVVEEFQSLELKDLYAAIGYEEETLSGGQNVLYPPDFVQTIINVKLNSFGFKLQDKGMKTIVSFHMEGFEASIKKIPAQEATLINFGIKSVEILDQWTLAASQKTLPLVIVDQQKCLIEKDVPDHVFEVEINTNPIDSRSEYAISVKTRPIIVTFSRPVVDKISDFFQSQSLGVEITKAKNQGLEAVQKKFESQLKYAMESKPQVDISLTVHSMTVVVPSDARQPDLPALVLDTGSLRLRSDLTAKETAKQKAIEENFMNDYFYDAYSLKWSKLCAYSIRCYESWGTPTQEPVYFLPPFDLDITLQTRQVPIVTIPNFMFSGSIPKIQINIAKEYLRDVLKVLQMVSKTTNEVVAAVAIEDPAKILEIVTPDPSQLPSEMVSTSEQPDEVAVQLKFTFTIVHTSIMLLYDDKGLRPLADIGLHELQMNAVMDDHQTTFLGKLHGLSVANLSENQTNDYILSSILEKDSQNFLEISVNLIDRSSPKYKGVDRDCSCSLEKIDFVLNRPVVATILHAVNEISDTFVNTAPKIEPLGSAVVEEGTDTKFNYKEYLAASQVIQVKQEPDYSQTPISLVFNLRSRELNVTLTEAKRPFMFLSLADFNYNSRKYQNGTTLDKGSSFQIGSEESC